MTFLVSFYSSDTQELHTKYTYDANGSLISKTTPGESEDETITYAYNLQNRLFKVTTNLESPPDTVNCVEYTYNDAGIRSRAYSYNENVPEQEKSNESTTLYLTDPASFKLSSRCFLLFLVANKSASIGSFNH
ncbi:MAG: RHS repeat protein [Sedimentisphaerales bacterium]|nr:RHS repeat protein [Sedimentisphaerales bacterium]